MRRRILDRAEQLLKEHPDYRLGQAIFNACSELYPDIAEQIRGTEDDCFHNTGLVNSFFAKVSQLKQQ